MMGPAKKEKDQKKKGNVAVPMFLLSSWKKKTWGFERV